MAIWFDVNTKESETTDMTIIWCTIGFAVLANLIGWFIRPQLPLNFMLPTKLERWRRNHRRIFYPLTFVGAGLLAPVITSTTSKVVPSAILAGILLALALRSFIGMVRVWGLVHGLGPDQRIRPRYIDLKLHPVDPKTRLGPGHETPNGVPRRQAGAIYWVQQRYRERFADAISRKLGRRVDGITPALALFLLDNIGDEPGWMDRIDLKIRMWLEPLLGGIRFDPEDTDQPLIWDLDDDETRIAIVLLRTDEAEACA